MTPANTVNYSTAFMHLCVPGFALRTLFRVVVIPKSGDLFAGVLLFLFSHEI